MKHPLSMTAFGRGDSGTRERQWTVEIRSVNHRFNDIKVKIARKYLALEEPIKKEVARLFSRGHIEVMIGLSGTQADGVTLSANLQLAREYCDCLKRIQQELGLQTPPDLAMVASLKDVIIPEELQEDMDAVWTEIQEALTLALNECMQMRIDEGQSLRTDLLQRLDSFGQTVAAIEQAIPELISKKEAALKERLNTLLQGVDLDPVRLAQEVAIIVDKSDITEELVRLKSHIQQFQSFMDLEEPVGRRLDFLSQEFLREINTMASKINDTAITHKTVELKNEIEKMREQVQNLE